MTRGARFIAALAAATLFGFVPPGAFALERSKSQAASRAGVKAVYEADGRRIELTISASGQGRFDAGLPQGVDRIVAALLAGRADHALRLVQGDPGRTALLLWAGAPALAVGIGAPRETEPRVLLDPERFVPLGLAAPGLAVRLLDTKGLLTAYGLPTRIEVEIEGLGTWSAHLAGPPLRKR